MIESWMISLAIAVVTYVAIFITVKNRGEANQKDIEELKKTDGKLYGRLDKHGDDLVALNTKSKLGMTSKEADETYLRRREFEQFEKHIDSRFDNIQDGQGSILNALNILLDQKSKVS